MADAAHVSGSLRNRLALILIGSAALLAMLLYLVMSSYAARIAQQNQDGILRASVTSVLEAATMRDGEIALDLPYTAFTMLNTPLDDRVFYAIHTNDRLLSGYDGLMTGQRMPLTGERFDTRQFSGDAVRVVSASRVLSDGRDRQYLYAAVAQTRDSLSETLERITRTTALFGLGFFLLSVVLSIWVADATVRPLNRLAGSVGRRGGHDLSPVSQPVPAEMGPLVSALNRLMTRLGASLVRSEDFIAEAAHRVRTPLATVRSHGEAMLYRAESDDNRQALRTMIRAIDESSRAASQLLDHAMVTFRADAIEAEHLTLEDICRDIIDRLAPVAEMKDVEIVLSADDPAPMTGDPILIQNAARNLLDNALKYAPTDSRIDVAVSSVPSPCIIIRDQGPGFPPDQIATLTDRFARGANAAGTVGSGLGLTIARDVAEAHGGRLELSNSAERGGGCVSLFF